VCCVLCVVCCVLCVVCCVLCVVCCVLCYAIDKALFGQQKMRSDNVAINIICN
jgi:hypothetical protein